MAQLTDAEIEELVLGIEVESYAREKPSPSPSPLPFLTPPPQAAKRFPPWVILSIILTSLLMTGLLFSTYALRSKLQTLSLQVDSLLQKLNSYEAPPPSRDREMIEPLLSPAPFDRSA